MGITEEIATIIKDNKESIAFMIGNGIHYQYKDCNKSWEDLLKDLWQKYTDNNIEIPDGISFTEFYDIIELNAYRPKPRLFDYDGFQKIFNVIKAKNIDSTLREKYLKNTQKKPFDTHNLSKTFDTYIKVYDTTKRDTKRIYDTLIGEETEVSILFQTVCLR